MEELKYFFSYARVDSDFVLQLAKELRAVGANLWLDQLDILGGQHWDSTVEQALKGCKGMIAVLSPESVASQNVMDEVSYALDEGKLVVPVLIRACDIPLRLRRVQYIDFTADYDTGFSRLLRALGIEQPARPVEPAAAREPVLRDFIAPLEAKPTEPSVHEEQAAQEVQEPSPPKVSEPTPDEIVHMKPTGLEAEKAGRKSQASKVLAIRIITVIAIISIAALLIYVLTRAYRLDIPDAVGGSVTRDPNKPSYKPGETVTLEAVPTVGYRFTNWSGALSDSNNPAPLVMDADKSVTANFVKTYSLTATGVNGSVTKDPDKVGYDEGDAVTLEAVPTVGYRFTNWSGDLSDDSNPTKLVMDADKTVTANFVKTYSLTATGVNGFVTATAVDGSSTKDPNQVRYDEGDTVELEAVPDPNYRFDGWSGELSGSTNPATLVMDADKSVTANFALLKAGVVLTNSIGMKLVYIPAGSFEMGSSHSATQLAGEYKEILAMINKGKEHFQDEFPQHQVLISEGFWMGQTEVTQGQYSSVMKDKPWSGKPNVQESCNYPAVHVSWEDAVEFCRKLSQQEGKTYRLPTEAEWEYACRASTLTRFSFGDNDKALGDYAWFKDDKPLAGPAGFKVRAPNAGHAHPVGQKKPNPWGLYDIHGNVWEWCNDWYDDEYYSKSPRVDPKGPSSGYYRSMRGASWNSVESSLRCSSRRYGIPVNGIIDVGFRVVRESLLKPVQRTVTVLEPWNYVEDDRKEEFIPLFNGKDLLGWKASGDESAFAVRDAMIVAQHAPSYLFYIGPVEGANFKNFEFEADVMTEPGANGGVFFHTTYQETGVPSKGYEVQIDNTGGDWRKTGSLWDVNNVSESPAKDNDWFRLNITVRDKRIIIKVNGKTTVDYIELEDFYDPDQPNRRLSRGTFALQTIRPESVVYYKNIMVKPLPSEPSVGDPRREAEELVSRLMHALQSENVDTLVQLSPPPLLANMKVLTTVPDIREMYQGYYEYDEPLREHGRLHMDHVMSGTIREYKDLGHIEENDPVLSQMPLDNDDIVVIMTAHHEDGTPERIFIYFRRLNGRVEVAGLRSG